MAREKTPFLSAHFSAIAHATEDIQKVEEATGFLIELISREPARLSRQYMKGHHGNLITTVSSKLPGKALFPNALEVLSHNLSESDKQFLAHGINSCVDEENGLYLRFDKQEACLQKVRLHQADPIRMKLKFVSGFDLESIVDLCREGGLVP